jgi:PhoPQ-activated pathogenicity-related protein
MRGGLKGYIARPEPVYKWERRGEKKLAGGTIYDLWLTSQTWQGLVWEHRLQLFVPAKLTSTDFCTLLNTARCLYLAEILRNRRRELALALPDGQGGYQGHGCAP